MTMTKATPMAAGGMELNATVVPALATDSRAASETAATTARLLGGGVLAA